MVFQQCSPSLHLILDLPYFNVKQSGLMCIRPNSPQKVSCLISRFVQILHRANLICFAHFHLPVDFSKNIQVNRAMKIWPAVLQRHIKKHKRITTPTYTLCSYKYSFGIQIAELNVYITSFVPISLLIVPLATMNNCRHKICLKKLKFYSCAIYIAMTFLGMEVQYKFIVVSVKNLSLLQPVEYLSFKKYFPCQSHDNKQNTA